MITDNINNTLSGQKRKAEHTVAPDVSPKKAKRSMRQLKEAATPTPICKKRKLQNPQEDNRKKKLKTSTPGPASTVTSGSIPAPGSAPAPTPAPGTTSATGTVPTPTCVPGPTTAPASTPVSVPASTPGPSPGPTRDPAPAPAPAPGLAPAPRLFLGLLLLLLLTFVFVMTIFFMTPTDNVLVCENTQYINDKGQCTECPFMYTCDGREHKLSIISAMEKMDLSKWDIPSAINMQSMISNLKSFEVDTSKWGVPNAINMQSMFSSMKSPSSWRSSSAWSPSSSSFA